MEAHRADRCLTKRVVFSNDFRNVKPWRAKLILKVGPTFIGSSKLGRRSILDRMAIVDKRNARRHWALDIKTNF